VIARSATLKFILLLGEVASPKFRGYVGLLALGRLIAKRDLIVGDPGN
jgi:hypothetical protein